MNRWRWVWGTKRGLGHGGDRSGRVDKSRRWRFPLSLEFVLCGDHVCCSQAVVSLRIQGSRQRSTQPLSMLTPRISKSHSKFPNACQTASRTTDVHYKLGRPEQSPRDRHAPATCCPRAVSKVVFFVQLVRTSSSCRLCDKCDALCCVANILLTFDMSFTDRNHKH